MADPEKKIVIVSGSLEGLTDREIQGLVMKVNASGEGHVRAPKALRYHFAKCATIGQGCPGTVHGIFAGSRGIIISSLGVNICSLADGRLLLGIAREQELISAYEERELVKEMIAAGVPEKI